MLVPLNFRFWRHDNSPRGGSCREGRRGIGGARASAFAFRDIPKLRTERDFILKNDFYVYVYIDPRNFEEFYFGKGTGSRKDNHLREHSDTDKSRRISEIKKASLKPIIRVIARDLSANDALLVEKTLLWKLGKQLTNISSGHYADKFRPHDTMHKEISGFDFKSGIYYFNVGDGAHRKWEDKQKFSFISAGQGPRWRDAICGFREGDIFAAYLKRRGFVGIGRIVERAKQIRDVKIKNKPLLNCDLACQLMSDNVESDDLCEYVALVEWKSTVGRKNAKWQPGLYTTTHVRASLDGQPETVKFLESQFKLNLRDLAR